MKELIKQSRASHIIDCAQEVFFEKGYSKTNITDVCKLANCSRTTTYTYFDSKENLYLAVVYKAFSTFLSHFANSLSAKDHGLEVLLKLSKGYIVFALDAPKEYRLILDFYSLLNHIDIQELHTETHTLIKGCAYFDRTKKLSDIPLEALMNQIKNGQKDGSINKTFTAREHMVNIWSYLKGITEVSPKVLSIAISKKNSRQLEKIVLLTIEKPLSN